jgi:hypothetical protein
MNAMNIEDAVDAYRAFDQRERGWMKVELAPGGLTGGMSRPPRSDRRKRSRRATGARSPSEPQPGAQDDDVHAGSAQREGA